MKKEKLVMNINHIIANELSVKLWQVDAAIKLIDEGNTIPFIARYRKPVTGELNDEQLRTLDERLKYLRNLEEKKKTVVDSITEQGKMTDEIMSKIAWQKQLLQWMIFTDLSDLKEKQEPQRQRLKDLNL